MKARGQLSPQAKHELESLLTQSELWRIIAPVSALTQTGLHDIVVQGHSNVYAALNKSRQGASKLLVGGMVRSCKLTSSKLSSLYACKRLPRERFGGFAAACCLGLADGKGSQRGRDCHVLRSRAVLGMLSCGRLGVLLQVPSL